jgi:hypothetical protein
MAKNIVEERLRWVLPVFNKEVRLIDVAKVCPHSQRSLERWLTGYNKHGKAGLEAKSTRPKTNPKETPIWIKEKVIDLRKENKKCSLKLHWELKEQGIDIHFQTIAKIIKSEGLTRKYRIRKIKYKYVRANLRRGDLVEVDVKYVPKSVKNRQYFQFTAIDVASRWRHLEVYDDISTFSAIRFLEKVINIASFRILSIKTDNGSCFTNRHNGGYVKSLALFPSEHAFDSVCNKYGLIHYLIDPGKPAQNGCVERSHRTDQEQFYDEVDFKSINELRLKIRLWNMHYNDLAHCGLNGKTPNQMLKSLNP